MREIKFRFWRYDRMIQWSEFEKVFDLYNFIHKKDVIAMQFTGLQDKNGKEIYEGDILKSRGKPYWDVIFRKGCFYLRNDKKDVEWSKSFDGIHFPHYEVIGNIYEKPELIK